MVGRRGFRVERGRCHGKARERRDHAAGQTFPPAAIMLWHIVGVASVGGPAVDAHRIQQQAGPIGAAIQIHRREPPTRGVFKRHPDLHLSCGLARGQQACEKMGRHLSAPRLQHHRRRQRHEPVMVGCQQAPRTRGLPVTGGAKHHANRNPRRGRLIGTSQGQLRVKAHRSCGRNLSHLEWYSCTPRNRGESRHTGRPRAFASASRYVPPSRPSRTDLLYVPKALPIPRRRHAALGGLVVHWLAADAVALGRRCRRRRAIC